jgi:hypothetical protein
MSNWWWKVARRWEALQSLRSPGERVLFIRILLFAAAVPVFMRFNLRRLGRWLEPGHIPPVQEAGKLHQIIDYVDRALDVGRPVVRRSCLTRGLTLYYFLRRAGLEVSLCFGMSRHERGFIGHCWLLKDGKPFLEQPDPELLFKAVYYWPEDRV